MKSDIEINNECIKKDILEIAKKINIDKKYIEQYGNDKAKINLSIMNEIEKNKDGNLILVTSINPTPYGEGKTTMSIGINDGLNKLGYRSLVVLREPSLGPVFGMKGGATGGGYSQVVPMEDINLHFTGDMHAITAANNLLCAAIDNHIFSGNELRIKSIIFSRCMDMNDRSLRNIKIGYNLKSAPREDSFVITVATEIMAILCLSKNLMDLKNRISNIMIGFNEDNNPIYVKDLQVEDAMTILLKDAIKPNLVQSLENNPVIIHGGPFANIAHGCNSVIATKMALKLSDYVITEAGFGADLGAEKFLDIKCRLNDLKPKVIVINATIRSIKYNGLCPKDSLKEESINYLEKGICNLQVHIDNMKKYIDNILVCINKFEFDTNKEIDYIKDFCKKMNVECYVNSSFKDGGIGAKEIGEAIVRLCKKDTSIRYCYNLNSTIKEKIEALCNNIYRASKINYSEEALKDIEIITDLGYSNIPICVAKTQYSISDDPLKLGYPHDYEINVKKLKLCSGASFIIVYMGDIMTMPGLSKNAAYKNMNIEIINNKTIIKGLF